MTETTTIKKSENQEPQALAIMPAARVKAVRQLSMTAKAASKEIAACGDDEQTKAFVIAHAIEAIRKCLSNEIMDDVMKLMNTPLGFKTDRVPCSKKQVIAYSRDVVRDVAVQALIRGLRLTGNEINIIASNLYVTKEGCKRLVREFPGLTDLKVQIGVPRTTGEGALVDAKSAWNLNGIGDALICEGSYAIPIRVNKAMGIDAIIGKAESKIFRRIYDRLMGSELSLPDPEESEQQGDTTEAA